MTQFDVLIIGRSCLDHIAVVERLPEENRKAPLELRLSEGGGQGSTAACCVARLGGRPLYVGRVGDDPEGRFCRQRLQDFGVNTDWVETVPGAHTPVAYVFVTRGSGARTIVYEPSRLPPVELRPELQSLIQDADAVLLDPALGLTEDSFAEQLRALQRRVRGQLVVTAGEYGAYYPVRETLYQVGIPTVEVADTIGAGDNFHAAFAYALARGHDLHQAVRIAVAAASMSCRKYGGRNGIPTWTEAQAVADRLRPRILQF